MTDAWFLRLELREPVPDDQLEDVRRMLLDMLEQAGWPAKPTTVDADLMALKQRQPEPFREQHRVFVAEHSARLRKKSGRHDGT